MCIRDSSYTGSSRTLSLTIRVPQDNYASFLEAAAQAGNLVDKSCLLYTSRCV